MTELWAPVLLNGGIFKDDYLVSNMGRVKQKHIYKNGNYKFVLVNIINSRRPMVKIIGNGKQYSKSLAKLVLSSFQWREGCECANITYLDGDMKNCRLSNLRYTVDSGVYTNADLQPKAVKKKIKRKPAKALTETPKKHPLIRSCKTCGNIYCELDTSSFSTDFGAEGCRQYKPNNN